MTVKNVSKFWNTLLTVIAYLFVLMSTFITYNASKHIKMLINLLKNDKELEDNYKIFLPEWEKWYKLGLVFSFIIKSTKYLCTRLSSCHLYEITISSEPHTSIFGLLSK